MGEREIIRAAFGRRLRQARQSCGWTQEELAKRTGRHWTYIGGVERGERNPTLAVIAELAQALGVSPASLVDEVPLAGFHPVTKALKASEHQILDAIQHGFSTMIDVKGKLAELFMHKELVLLRKKSLFDSLTWQDMDGSPDFLVEYHGHQLRVECKNIRNETYKKVPAFKVELQRTRNSLDGTPTRGYKWNDFDVLGVALFNQTAQWQFVYVATGHLERRPTMPEFLSVMQRVPMTCRKPWTVDPIEAFDDAIRAVS